MSRWTRTLRVSIDHPTLSVEATNAVLQTRIRTDSIVAAALVRFAIVVSVALELITFLAGFPLISFGAQTHRSVVGNSAEGVDSAWGSAGRTRIFAFAVGARQRGRAVRMGSTSVETQSVLASVSFWTAVVDVTFDSAFSSAANFAAFALILGATIAKAKADFVALAMMIARGHSSRTADEGVAVIIRRAGALRGMIEDATSGAFAAGLATFAGIFAAIRETGLFARTRIVTPASDQTNSVFANLICKAVVVAVANCFAQPGLAALVVQAFGIASTGRVTSAGEASVVGQRTIGFVAA